jgi:hypothetical protein
MTAPDYCSAETISAAIDLPVSSFHQYVERGLLPKGVKIGKHRLWSRAAVYNALALLTEGPSTKSVAADIRGFASEKTRRTA